MDENLTFEEAFAKLSQLVELLEKGDKPLEESVSLYDEAMQLSGYCSALLNSAKLKIETLTRKQASDEL